jgi:hypothetical protein
LQANDGQSNKVEVYVLRSFGSKSLKTRLPEVTDENYRFLSVRPTKSCSWMLENKRNGQKKHFQIFNETRPLNFFFYKALFHRKYEEKKTKNIQEISESKLGSSYVWKWPLYKAWV